MTRTSWGSTLRLNFASGNLGPEGGAFIVPDDSALMDGKRFQLVYPVLPMDLLGIYVLLPE